MERNDILAADRQSYWVAMKRVIEPYQGARNDFDIFAELSDRLGVGADFAEGRDEMQWLRFMYEEARDIALKRDYAPPLFDEFWQVGHYRFPAPHRDPAFLEEFVADPAGNPLKTPSGKIEIFSTRVDGFQYDDCPGHPTWLEPTEWLGAPLAKRQAEDRFLVGRPHERPDLRRNQIRERPRAARPVPLRHVLELDDGIAHLK